MLADGYTKAAIMLGEDCLENNIDNIADSTASPVFFSANTCSEESDFKNLQIGL